MFTIYVPFGVACRVVTVHGCRCVAVFQTYQVAYVIVKAANAPRPGQWILERSVDGVSYTVWQYFAMTDSDCWNVFGVEPTIGVPRYTTDDEVHCSSAFSHLNPLENGEVMYICQACFILLTHRHIQALLHNSWNMMLVWWDGAQQIDTTRHRLIQVHSDYN